MYEIVSDFWGNGNVTTKYLRPIFSFWLRSKNKSVYVYGGSHTHDRIAFSRLLMTLTPIFDNKQNSFVAGNICSFGTDQNIKLA